MKRLIFFGMTLAFAAAMFGGTALARDHRISGGIQYVNLAGQAKEKRQYSDANRMYRKAVVQLTEGIEKSPKDVEAWDYLGQAYAELDIPDSAGWAFGEGIRQAEEKGGKKKLVERMKTNRKFYWQHYYQVAFETYRMGTEETDPQAVRDSATRAVETMKKAIAVNPTESIAYCNVAVFMVKAEQLDEALDTVNQGLVYAPRDSCLLGRLESLTLSMGERAAESGDYGAAIETYEALMADHPDDVNNAQRLAELYFQQGGSYAKQAGEATDEAAKATLAEQRNAAYANAAKYFGMYYEKNPEDQNGRYNYSLALVRALKFGEALEVMQGGLEQDPTSVDFHALMATAYTALGNDDQATAHRLITMVLNDGIVVDDPAGFADASAKKWGAKADAPKLLTDLGTPEEVRTMTRGEYETETWFWWSKRRAVTMVKGRKVTDLDFAQVAMVEQPTEAAPTGTP
jgi:predicted Zn-dependent protease